MRRTKETMKNTVFAKEISVAVFALFLFAGCAGTRHTRTQEILPGYDLSVAEGVRIAAQAMQRLGFWVTKQNEAAGSLFGEKVRGRGIYKGTYYLQVHVGGNPGKPIKINATSIAGPEIAFTNELPGIVSDFYIAFEDILAAKSIDFSKKKPSASSYPPQTEKSSPKEYDL
jgi:hypothetical protein